MFIHVVITYNYKCHDGVFYPVLTKSIDSVRYFVTSKTRKRKNTLACKVFTQKHKGKHSEPQKNISFNPGPKKVKNLKIFHPKDRPHISVEKHTELIPGAMSMLTTVLAIPFIRVGGGGGGGGGLETLSMNALQLGTFKNVLACLNSTIKGGMRLLAFC